MVKCLPQISLRGGTLKTIKKIGCTQTKNEIPCKFERDLYYSPTDTKKKQ